MSCSALNDANALLPVTIAWYSPKGVQLTSDDSQQIEISNEINKASGHIKSILSIYPVNRTDDGVHTCRAFNDKDCYTESKINLTVECEHRLTTL